jgi:hypothetical protein
MQQKTLMLITDISGYTRFITQVGHERGLKHAQELLQIIINSNTLGLKLCEVEGDAVFFYTMKKMPSAKAILQQIGRTYRAFNHYLAQHALESDLGIKFFLHSGDCEEMRIGGRVKLFGTEVIKIHRLLKCISDRSDYLLVTENAGHLLSEIEGDLVAGETTFPHIGVVSYSLFDSTFFVKYGARNELYTKFIMAITEVGAFIATELSRRYRWYNTYVNTMAGAT